ncbi:FadR/GntR family transcriptional regulator [Paracandidimonas soli]|uniref:DNA-binding FadR family transcriptional regulator n=1 Tax=Paracandidimonas soli TaxID=1917182 RepID=A0A4R3UN54_9BURK|nr:FadR/GntR family transcriptional regulator [Paracandidimonas soli]TCU93136.1 DNA-binding FadR family transcriptional regulator [Paracandidimonas soli]
MFEPFLKPVNMPDAIAQQIRQKILAHEFAEGSKLPSEHEFSQMFGVSRNVVREAVARLKLSGLLETRRGIGTFISTDLNAANFQVHVDDLLDFDQLKHIFQLRIEIEAGAAALAAENRTEEQLQALKQALEDTTGTDQDWEQGAKAAYHFHQCVVACAQNPYFDQLYRHLSSVLSKAVRTLRKKSTGTERIGQVHQEHIRIFRAIRDKDAMVARLAMREHLNNGFARYGLLNQRRDNE